MLITFILLSSLAEATPKKTCVDHLDKLRAEIQSDPDRKVVIPDIVDGYSHNPWPARDAATAAAQEKMFSMTRHEEALLRSVFRETGVVFELATQGWAAWGRGERPTRLQADAMHMLHLRSNHPERHYEYSPEFERLISSAEESGSPATEH